MRKTKKLAAVALTLGAALATSATPAAATTGGAQLAACTSADYNAHLVWFKLTNTDGTTFCVGGGAGTVGVSADIKAFDTFGVNTVSPTVRYYGYLDVTVGGFASKWYIGDWPSPPEDNTDWYTVSLPCPPPPPGFPRFCPTGGSSVHVTGVEIVGVDAG